MDFAIFFLTFKYLSFLNIAAWNLNIFFFFSGAFLQCLGPQRFFFQWCLPPNVWMMVIMTRMKFAVNQPIFVDFQPLLLHLFRLLYLVGNFILICILLISAIMVQLISSKNYLLITNYIVGVPSNS